eukprot:gene44662-55576_t
MFPDKILIGSTIAPGDLHKDRYKLSHSIWSLKHNRVVAEGYGTVVSYDFANSRSCDFPPALVRSIEAVQALDSLHLHDSIVQHASNVDDEF